MNHQETGAKPGNEDVLVNDQSKIGVQIHNCRARKLPASLNELGSVTFHLHQVLKIINAILPIRMKCNFITALKIILPFCIRRKEQLNTPENLRYHNCLM